MTVSKEGVLADLDTLFNKYLDSNKDGVIDFSSETEMEIIETLQSYRGMDESVDEVMDALLDGLTTRLADANKDGKVNIDELKDYVMRFLGDSVV